MDIVRRTKLVERLGSRIWGARLYLVSGMFLLAGSCLPDNALADLTGSSLSAVVSVLLSDLLNVVIPPIA